MSVSLVRIRSIQRLLVRIRSFLVKVWFIGNLLIGKKSKKKSDFRYRPPQAEFRLLIYITKNMEKRPFHDGVNVKFWRNFYLPLQ